MEATLNGHGYTPKALSETLGLKQAKIRALFRQELGAERSRDIKKQMLVARHHAPAFPVALRTIGAIWLAAAVDKIMHALENGDLQEILDDDRDA